MVSLKDKMGENKPNAPFKYIVVIFWVFGTFSYLLNKLNSF